MVEVAVDLEMEVQTFSEVAETEMAVDLGMEMLLTVLEVVDVEMEVSISEVVEMAADLGMEVLLAVLAVIPQSPYK